MPETTLRPLNSRDVRYFTKWWRDDYLRSVTSGDQTELSDKEIVKYFSKMLNSTNDFHFMIVHDGITIGHLSLNQRPKGWYETQIIIGEDAHRGHGYGPAAINQLMKFAHKQNIEQIYLEVRPDNHLAISAYEKCGFKKTRTIERPDEPNLKTTLKMEYHS